MYIPGVGGIVRLGSVTKWTRRNKITLYLGEFAGGYTSNCAIEVYNHISYMESNRDVWKGWTVWGGNFPSNYMYYIDPIGNYPTSYTNNPLLSFYTPFFNKTF